MTDYDFLSMQTAPPEGAICDFCNSPDVRWSYPCRTHARKTEQATIMYQGDDGSLDVMEMSLDGVAEGAWAACSACHALVQRGDRDRLARRCGKRILKLYPDMKMSLPNVIAHVRRMQDQFWANREGPPIHHDTRPKEDPTR